MVSTSANAFLSMIFYVSVLRDAVAGIELKQLSYFIMLFGPIHLFHKWRNTRITWAE